MGSSRNHSGHSRRWSSQRPWSKDVAVADDSDTTVDSQVDVDRKGTTLASGGKWRWWYSSSAITIDAVVSVVACTLVVVVVVVVVARHAVDEVECLLERSRDPLRVEQRACR